MILHVICEYYTDEFDGTADTFSIIDVMDEEGGDYTFLVSPEMRYWSLDGARYDIVERLGVASEELMLEEV